MAGFASTIISWYKSNKRELPWRNTNDPYKIWVSEIILQQTRVEQGVSYYRSFIEHFPDVVSLAKAPEKKVLKVWQGLGYYSRARNMQHAAKQIVTLFNGNIPNNRDELLKLKGVGRYTSAAIASIAFGLPHAAVDGNVYRVLSRCFAVETPIDTIKGQREFEQLSNDLMENTLPKDYNQALMELGALVCTPTKPLCNECPLFIFCQARKDKNYHLFPQKSKKVSRTKRYFNYLVICNDEFVGLTHRQDEDIWKGLYEFPLLEGETLLSTQQVAHELTKEGIKHEVQIDKGKDIKHLLTHRELHIRFFHITLPCNVPFITQLNNKSVVKIKKGETTSLPTHKIITNELSRIRVKRNK